MAIGEREWDDPGQLDQLVRLFRSGRSEALVAPFRYFATSPIQPGDPLQISCLAQGATDDGWVEISVAGHLLETLHLPAVTAAGARVRPASGSPAARALYQVGLKRLTFKTTGAHGSTCQQLPLEVAAPDLSQWWSWRWPEAGRSCYWRTPYRVGGELTNLGAAGLRIVHASFAEASADGTGRWITDVRTSPAVAASQGVLGIACEPVQEWEWTSWNATPRGEDYARRFGYELHAGLEDEFGNRYQLRARLQQPVAVLISPQKRNWWRTKAALLGAAIALLVKAACVDSQVSSLMAHRIFGVPSLPSGRGLVRRVHELATGTIPRTLDFSTRLSWPRKVVIEEVISGELSWPDRQLVESLLDLEYLVALHEAMVEVEAKWQAARTADELEATRNQRSDHLDLLRLTYEEWVRISYRVNDLRAEQRSDADGDAAVPYRLAEWQETGVPAATLDSWERQGLPGRWIEDVVVAGGGMLWAAEGVLGYVRRALEAALFATRDVLTAHPEVGPSQERP